MGSACGRSWPCQPSMQELRPMCLGRIELTKAFFWKQALTSFRDHAASLLLATPAASRGLDLPEIAYIYNLDPPSTAVDYVHRAGRAGRIGSSSPGRLVSSHLATPAAVSSSIIYVLSAGCNLWTISPHRAPPLHHVSVESITLIQSGHQSQLGLCQQIVWQACLFQHCQCVATMLIVCWCGVEN